MTATLTDLRVTCSRAILAAALKDAVRALPAKASLPILTCVHLSCNGAVLRVGATDLSIALVRRVELDDTQDLDFAVAVPGEEIATLLGNLGTATVELLYSAETHTLKVVADGVRATFKTQPASDYPKLPSATDATWEIPSLTLRQALDQTLFCAADDADASRATLAGISIVAEGEHLTAIAADGFVAAVSRHGLLLPMGTPLDELIPATSGKLLLSLLSKGDAVVGISKQGGELVFSFGDTTLGTRLIEGKFPDLSRVMLTECATTVVCSASGLLAAVRQVEVLAEKRRDEKSKGPAVTVCRLVVSTGELQVSASGSLGDGAATLVASVEGEPLTIAVSTIYLRSALDAIGAQPVEIGLNSPSLPLRLRRVGEKDYTQVIMPMHMAQS